MQPVVTKATTAIVVVAGLVIALFAGIAQSKTAIVALIVYLPLAWLTVFILALRNPGERRSAQSMLKRFHHQVDLAEQQLSSDPHVIDNDVLAAFNKLHTDIKALLAQKKIRVTELKRELARFPYPYPSASATATASASQQGSRWRPPTLSELGYVIGMSDTVAPDAPLLALYRFSGEERTNEGGLVDTFTIIPASVPRAHAAQFSAKVHSPKPKYVPVTNPPSAAPVSSASAARLAQPQPNETHKADEPITTADAAQATQATQADNSMGYALSLLGPITLSNTRELAQNIRAMAQLTADAAPSPAMPAAGVRQNLRDLITERLAHSPASLTLARQALRQAPQLLVAAIADACRDGETNPTALLPTLATLTEILLPSAPAARPALALLTNELVAFIQSLRVISSAQNMLNPGIVYVEARGAETDAAFLRQIAYWLMPANQDANAHAVQVIVTTNMSEQVFRAQLHAYGELQPGHDNYLVLDTLLVAMNLKTLTLLTLHGADKNRPVKVREHLPVGRNKPFPWLLLSANPAMVDLAGCPPPVHHILWTLTGRGLDTGSGDLITQYYERWHAITLNAAAGATATPGQ